MSVKVAGYNIDADLLKRIKILLSNLKGVSGLEEADLVEEINFLTTEDNLTPETISAAYARISRDPSPVGELRKMARRNVARARRSNEKIVFDMGHASVAEHAVFNIDVVGISRLSVETIEARRLMSFTEKSQRYIALAREYIIPPELKDSVQGEELRELCQSLFDGYHQYLPVLESHFRKCGAEKPELPAREDARYLLPLACAAQLGLTANARNIEHLLRRTVNHPLKELREFSAELKSQVEHIAPSLIRYVESGDVGDGSDFPFPPRDSSGEAGVKLLHFTGNPDNITLAASIFAHEALPWEEAMKKADGMDDEQSRGYLRKRLNGLKSHHSLPRFFESVEFAFQAVVSSAAFGQLKRHRISTQLCHPYNPKLSFTLPESFKAIKLEGDFAEKMKRAEDLYHAVYTEHPHCAPYALTNAHRRMVYFRANAREMHHLARLRMDKTAQWDIRAVVTEMVDLAREKAPLTMALACGKDEFDGVAGEFFG